MTHPEYIREKAREMRADKKLTIDELSERLAISRSTVYHWVRDLPIPRTLAGTRGATAAQRKGNRVMRNRYRRMREAAYEEGLGMYLHFIGIPAFRDFVVIFITEGHRRNRHGVSIANSDPAVILLATRWMRLFSRRRLSYAVQVHADQDLGEVRRYWAGLLAVDPADIALQRKSNSGNLKGRNWRSRYGVLTVRTGDTYFREEMQAWTDCLRDAWLDSAVDGA